MTDTGPKTTDSGPSTSTTKPGPDTKQTSEDKSVSQEPEVDQTAVTETPMAGGATGSTGEAKPEDPLYVPVVNANYIPEDAPDKLEGYVPGTPGDDRTLLRIKEALETHGLTAGPTEPEPEPEPTGKASTSTKGNKATTSS